MNTQRLPMGILPTLCIMKHSSNVVAQLTKMCRSVGCRPVRLSSSRLSPVGLSPRLPYTFGGKVYVGHGR